MRSRDVVEQLVGDETDGHAEVQAHRLGGLFIHADFPLELSATLAIVGTHIPAPRVLVPHSSVPCVRSRRARRLVDVVLQAQQR